MSFHNLCFDVQIIKVAYFENDSNTQYIVLPCVQAVMNNRKFIIIDYVAVKKAVILHWRMRFLRPAHKQSLHLKGNVLRSRA